MRKDTERHWLALYTKVNQEFKAQKQLDALNLINYLPTVIKIKQWSDRTKKVTEAILKGYIFICSDESERLLALEQNSIVRCLFENGKPAIIPDLQIENFKKLLEQNYEFSVYRGLIDGQEVEITDGPLAGIRGVIQSTSKGKHISVSIKLLNRTIVAKINEDSVLKVQ
jgi:transcriptional antiterminator RfaH